MCRCVVLLRHVSVSGIILADTKFEFGFNAAGELVVADEIFTPDCSRFWSLATYEPGRQQDSLDKQVRPSRYCGIVWDSVAPALTRVVARVGGRLFGTT